MTSAGRLTPDAEAGVLRAVAEALNQAAGLPQVLDRALEAVLPLVDADAGWIVLLEEPGGPRLAAARNLPPALETDDRAAMQGPCECLDRLRRGDLPSAHVVECERLHAGRGDTRGLRHHASIPLRAAGRALGNLNLTQPPDRVFSETELSTLTAIGNQIAVAIERARLHEQVTAQRVEEQTALLALSQALLGTTEAQAVMDQAIAAVAKAFRPELCKILLPDEAGVRLRLCAGRGWGEGVVGRATVSIGADSQAGYTLTARQPVAVDDFAREARFRRPALLAEHGVMAGMSAPMQAGARAVGVLGVHWRQPRAFTDEELRLLALFANATAQALERARLFEAERRQRELAEALRDTAAALSGTLDFDEVLDRILANVGRVVPHDAANITLIEAGVARLVRGRSPARSGPDEALLRLRLHVADVPYFREMAENRQPVVIPDTHADPRWVRLPESAWVRSYVGVPIGVRGQVLGFLNLDSATPGYFTPAHSAHLHAFADQAGLALENARLLDEARRRADQFAALYELSHDLATQTDVQSLLETIVARARQLLKAPAGAMTVVDQQMGDFEVVVAQGSSVVRGMRIAPAEGAVGRVAQNRQPVIVDDYRTWSDRIGRFVQFELRAMVHVPMLYSGELIGVLNVAEVGESTRRFTQADARLLSLFASQAAGVVHTARLLEETRAYAEKLRQSEANYRALFQRVPDGVYRTTPDGRFLTANPAFVHMLGYASEAELKAVEIARDLYLDPAERSRWQQKLEAEGEARNVELVLKRKGGRAITVLDNTRLVRDRDGAVLYYEGVLTDITERKQAEEALRLSEERFAKAFTASPSALVISRLADGRILEVNDAWVTVFGYSREVAIGHSSLALDLLDAEARERAVAQLRAQGFVRGFEVDIRRKSGEVRHASLSSESIEIDGEPCLLTIIDDITERKRAEERLRLQGSALEAAANGIVIADRQGIIRWVNPAFTRLTGYTSEEAIGQTPRLVRSGEHDQAFYRVLWDTILAGQVWRGEVVNRRKDGSVYTEEQTITPVRDDRGEVTHFVAIKQDVTERRQRERELEAVAAVSAALRAAPSRAEMLPVILDQLLDLLGAGGTAVALRDPASGQTVIELARGEWAPMTGVRLPPGAGVSGQVIASGEPYVCEDVRSDPRFARPEWVGDLNAVACVPLLAQERAIGALLAACRTPFAEAEVRLLSAIAGIAGNAMQRAALHEQTARRAEELGALSAIGRRLTESLDLTAVLDGLLDVTKSILPGHTLAIMLYDPARDELWIEAAHGYPTDAWRSFRVRRGEGVTGGVAARLEPALVRRVANTPEWIPVEGLPPSGAELAVPLIFQGRLVGVINAESLEAEAFDETHLRLLGAIADYAAVAVENARLFAETGRRLERLEALHAVDAAISGSLDLRVTLAVLLDQVTRQLGVDAADVLLLEPHAQTLEFAAGRGFRTGVLERTRLHLDEGLAGRAALEQRVVSTPDLATAPEGAFARTLIAQETFVAHHAVPLVAKGQVKGVLEVFHRSRLDPGAEWLEFLVMLATQAAIAIDNAALFDDLQRSNVELAVAYDATVEGWGRALELRDAETEGHTRRVTEMAVALAQAMGLGEAEIGHLRLGALLHDIGKMGIPDSILLKPGPLTEGERAIMRDHPVYAYEMLSPIAYLRPALDIPHCHHERWDGAGYPRGLKGERIPLAARIFAVADVWDALRSDRPYRPAWPEAAAREYIRLQAGKHFDPRVVEAFERMVEGA